MLCNFVRPQQSSASCFTKRDTFIMLDIAQILNIVLINGRTHAPMRITFGDKRHGKRLPWNTYRQPSAGIGAGGFSVEIFQLIGQVARGALKLIQHASRIEQNLPQRKVIDDLIVVIHFIADIVNFILEIVFIRNLDADRRKDNSDIVFRFGFCQ